ncbi:unnamed protein product [Mytilus coruscus]|uniref:Uncharacterized protein n=1 Tax=Mytilus coruscus TaxID=42192 RepID=A0A6J8CM25_MYTCO|nr:unnamed protein product [Mytilus coruscus]
MSSEDYHMLPAFMQEISSQCKDHKKKFELYCSFLASPCYAQCITDEHRKCQDMKPLSDILKQVKSSASVQLFHQDLKNVKENLDTSIKFLKTRISTINTQKTKAVEEIRTCEPLWTFQHQDTNYPGGITLNMNGFVYIASNGNNGVVVVSPDGKTCKTILSETEEINYPYAIDINRETGMMPVSSQVREDSRNHDTAFVYKI